MKSFTTVHQLITITLLLSACSPSKEKPGREEKLSMTIGVDEDYKVKAFYDGEAWGRMSKSLVSFGNLSDGPVKVNFLADTNYSLMSTQHYSVWIAGTLLSVDTNGDYFSWDLRVSSKQPLDLVFSGFQNTNGFKTNEDGTVFSCKAGETKIQFTSQLTDVFEKQKPRFHK